ncbi:PREDICTED: protein trichome birefringence-like 19 [Ipomoea nil]|uniref:protein trichome birefringence-like 19 n=1 Tax=Ipomoea nil TaxID=35883 RepID=UPI0009008552|nr:PREDICTED: protein trichome birefringence-like 19 [Ipomoea nil]
MIEHPLQKQKQKTEMKDDIGAEPPRRRVLGAFRKAVLPISITLVIFATFCFTSYNISDSLLQSFSLIPGGGECNIFKGNWVPFPEGPYYTNATKCDIEDRQNCMKFGRPDTGFLKWRWQPDGCELPLFDGRQFLELVRGKTMAFVGDSVARNQMESLKCLLASVDHPVKVSDGAVGRWVYKEYNFTLLSFWSPHIVKAKDADPLWASADSRMNLYTDEADKVWADEMADVDVVIFSAGQWFFRPFFYYKKGKIVGCHICNETTIKKRNFYFGYGLAFRTAFKTLLDHEKFKGLVILRTFSPAHFENGEWNKGGNCARTRPFTKGEMKLEGFMLEMYLTQVREFMAAKKEGSKKGVRFRLLNTTESMVLRPEGHPNHYGHWAHENKTIADCVHWCMPGPIDTWNEFLLQVLKMETPQYKSTDK